MTATERKIEDLKARADQIREMLKEIEARKETIYGDTALRDSLRKELSAIPGKIEALQGQKSLFDLETL